MYVQSEPVLKADEGSQEARVAPAGGPGAGATLVWVQLLDPGHEAGSVVGSRQSIPLSQVTAARVREGSVCNVGG